MSEPAYKTSAQAPADPTAPLRDWLTAIGRREARAEIRAEDNSRVVEMPRLRQAPPAPVADEAADVEALMAENMVLRAKLGTEEERYERLQDMLAEELRGLRALVREESERAEAMREERDLWMARAEALAQPIFQRR